MSAQTSPSAAPVPPGRPRRGWQSRKLRFLAAFVVVAVTGYLALTWLLLPAELRRLHGSWKVVQVKIDGVVANPPAELGHAIFSGNQLRTCYDDRQRSERYVVQVRTEGELSIFEYPEFEWLGMKLVNLFAWGRGDPIIVLRMEWTDSGLVLHSVRDAGIGSEQRELFLERE